MQGWSGIVMPHWDADAVDHLEPIGDEEALAMTGRLSQEEGIFTGISTARTSSALTGSRSDSARTR